MRLLGALLFALGALCMTKPASAQMYDPRYPVCMHVYGELIGERMDCIFASMRQCQASAVGNPATCLVNPFYAPRPVRPSKPAR
ncbi:MULTISPECIES: DUF3551 domain-containing protein [Bradyrhizobium]|uniref:DUF3551 domain-containing protein n=1 Tax=Bradyrhizobium embrapense TaxID=630921 RepID=UPI000A00D6E0|nr:DUF3551 domain-containing protein [Bradyrhizobium embrapense]